jgi:hypothetical protein
VFGAIGWNNNILLVVPDWQIVVARLGLDGDRRITAAQLGEFLRMLGESLLDRVEPPAQPHPPVGACKVVKTCMNTPLSFIPADFPFYDQDGDTFRGICLASLPAQGELRLDGAPVIVNQDVLDVGRLTYCPAQGGSGTDYTSFRYWVRDSSGTVSELPYTLTVDVVSPMAPRNVPEAAGYTLVYSLNLPTLANYNTNSVPYTWDSHATIGTFSRIGYYLELQLPGAASQFIWVSLDAFTSDAHHWRRARWGEHRVLAEQLRPGERSQCSRRELDSVGLG